MPDSHPDPGSTAAHDLLRHLAAADDALPSVDHVADDHLAMMMAEVAAVSTVTASTHRGRPRMSLWRPLRRVGVGSLAAAAFAVPSLAVAGALPEGLQHRAAAVARTVGVTVVPDPRPVPTVERTPAPQVIPAGTSPQDPAPGFVPATTGGAPDAEAEIDGAKLRPGDETPAEGATEDGVLTTDLEGVEAPDDVRDAAEGDAPADPAATTGEDVETGAKPGTESGTGKTPMAPDEDRLPPTFVPSTPGAAQPSPPSSNEPRPASDPAGPDSRPGADAPTPGTDRRPDEGRRPDRQDGRRGDDGRRRDGKRRRRGGKPQADRPQRRLTGAEQTPATESPLQPDGSFQEDTVPQGDVQEPAAAAPASRSHRRAAKRRSATKARAAMTERQRGSTEPGAAEVTTPPPVS